MKPKRNVTGAEALFAAAFTYALTGILVRKISLMWSDSAQVAVRFGIVVLIMAVYGLARKKKIDLAKGELRLAFGLGVLFAALVLLFTSAIGKTTIANVLFVFFATNMISAFVLGTILLKETITRNKILALGFAMTGLAVYSNAVIEGNLGIIFAILSGICGGATSLVNKQLKGASRDTVLMMQYAVATMFSAVCMLLSGDKIVRTASLEGFLLTVLFALVIILGSYLTLYGFQNFDVNVGTVITSAEIVFGAMLAYLIYGEVPRAHELVGGFFIMVGSVVGSGVFDKQKRPVKQMAQPD